MSLSESLPESIDRDNVREVAKVIDEKLHELDVMTELCSLYPRIDELSSNLIDALAIQLHVDFYDTTLDLENRRALVKNSILWHMKKGTPFAVAGVVSAAFDKTEVKEWYEYGGEPYHFKIVTEYVTTEKDKLAQMRRAIESVKNVRSWLDAIEFILHLVDRENPTEYGRASPPFIFYNSLEPDMLEAVAAVPELVEQYTACYQYNGGISYDGSGWYGNEWKYDGNPDAMPPPFEACRFDGTATYDGTRTYEAPRLAGARYTTSS